MVVNSIAYTAIIQAKRTGTTPSPEPKVGRMEPRIFKTKTGINQGPLPGGAVGWVVF